MSAPTIVFDLDGTLVDSCPDLIGTLSWLLEQEGLDPIVYDEARALIGHGIKPMVEKALTAAECEGLLAEFARYEKKCDATIEIFRERLDALGDIA